ncbi:MAG: ATP-binding protein [Thermoproteota archaeon]|nr:ATP-binding protein [Thermoproteota archaeon]
MKRIRLRFDDLQIEFTARDRALSQVSEWADRGTGNPVVIFGPEGCGKSAFLLQATAMLKEMGYDVFYLHPLDKIFEAEIEEIDVKRAFLDFVQRAAAEDALGRVAWAVFDFVREGLKRRKRKVAVIADDVFQAIGLNRAAIYVKGLLNMIEHPFYNYEKMVVLVATSEGLTRYEIGRHRWAYILPMWNMNREEFEQLYQKIPGPKPSLEEAWKLTGGNPYMLQELYRKQWNADDTVTGIIEVKSLRDFIFALTKEERAWLIEALDDPDTLYTRERLPLLHKLVEINLAVSSMYSRIPNLWIDIPPPEKDLELGIGKYASWQTPLHREAIRRILMKV